MAFEVAMFDEHTVTYPLDLSVRQTDTLTVSPFGESDNMSCDCRLHRNGRRLANVAVETMLTRRTERYRRKKLARDKNRVSWCIRKRFLGDYHVMASSASPATFYSLEEPSVQAVPHFSTSLDYRCVTSPERTLCLTAGSSLPPTLPRDPRDWSRPDVHEWLVHMRDHHDMQDVQCERFPMNGKALCLMSIDMFRQRVPGGGKLLYRDFQLRLGRAMTVPV